MQTCRYVLDEVSITVVAPTPALSAMFLKSVMPKNESSLQSVTNITLQFSQHVALGSGDVVLSPSGGFGDNAPIIISVDVNNTKIVNKGAGGPKVTLDVGRLPDQGSKVYGVTMANGVFMDLYSKQFVGIEHSSYTFTVTDSTGPMILSYVPTPNATSVPQSSHLVIRFDEDVMKGNGTIKLTSTPIDSYQVSSVIAIEVNSTAVTISGQCSL